MLRTNLIPILMLLALGRPSFTAAGPPSSSRLNSFEDLRGRVEVSSSGATVLVTLRDEHDLSVLRSYLVRTEKPLRVPLSVAADGAEVQVGCGRLLVTLPAERGSLEFHIPLEGPRSGEADVVLGAKSENSTDVGRNSGTSLRARTIVVRSGPAVLLAAATWIGDDDPKVYGSEGVVGISRGSSCSIQCSATSSCSAICRSPRPRCAVCSCPAHCTCR